MISFFINYINAGAGINQHLKWDICNNNFGLGGGLIINLGYSHSEKILIIRGRVLFSIGNVMNLAWRGLTWQRVSRGWFKTRWRTGGAIVSKRWSDRFRSTTAGDRNGSFFRTNDTGNRAQDS